MSAYNSYNQEGAIVISYLINHITKFKILNLQKYTPTFPSKQLRGFQKIDSVS